VKSILTIQTVNRSKGVSVVVLDNGLTLNLRGRKKGWIKAGNKVKVVLSEGKAELKHVK